MGNNGILNKLIPEKSKANSLEFSKAKQLIGVGLFVAVATTLSSLRPFLTGDIPNALIVLVLGLLMFAGIISFRATASRLISGNSIVFSMYALLTLTTFNSDGLAPDVSNFVFVILLSLMFSGTRSGIIWGVVCAITTIILYSVKSESAGQAPSILSPEQAMADAFGSYLVLIIATLVIGIVYEIVSSRNLTNFESSKKESEIITNEIQIVLNDVSKVMEAVANSDLSKEITAEFEGDLAVLKDSVNNTLTLLSGTLFNVTNACERLNTGATELTNSAQTLSDGTTRQAASLEEITSSMNEIENQVKTNDDHATQSQQLTNETLQVVKTGGYKMSNMLDSINKISETSSNVTKVIKVIDEIAFQTNLLALNAAVEAARAGKYGKGFSVVAEEVRSLAGRSAEAAKNTTELIENSIKEVENGVKNANETADVLNQISDSVEKVNDLISEIAAASKEQKGGIIEINAGLSQVNEVVMQNSSISEQTAAASENLTFEASGLQKMMRRFSLKSSHTDINRDQRKLIET